ncbi:MAG: polysaccharide deacetylase family protein [Paludibacter sp.]|nr:polysaccharide deacetylase family protein [Paludibacter sp.]
MKVIKKLIILMIVATCQGVLGQRVAQPYEIGTWQGFKPAAISYTFDDNCPNQLAKAVPLFDTKGFKVTLFTTINWNPNWTGLQAASNIGHEIASHTVSHPSLDSISVDKQLIEYRDSRNTIDTKISGSKCMTIAYPFCSCDNFKLCSEYYMAARSCDGFIVPSTPSNFMCISSINCGTEGPAKTATDLNVSVESAVSKNGWCVFMFHGIDNDNGYSPISSEDLGAHLDYVAANRSKYWINTFGNVIRYIKERNAVQLTVNSESSKRITLQLTDTLDNAIYNYPVTIRRPMPTVWKGASVTQGTENLVIHVVRKNQVAYIQFDAIPNAGAIVITKQKRVLPENAE